MTPNFVSHESRPIPSLEDLGNHAVEQFYAATCLPGFLDRTEFDDLYMVRWLYSSRSCDVFAVALKELVGWPIVAVGEPEGEPVHRLNLDPRGRLVDVNGVVALSELRQRYELPQLVLQDWDERSSYCAITDVAVADAMAAMLHLSCEPFTSLAARAREWAKHGCITMPENVSDSPACMDFFRRHRMS